MLLPFLQTASDGLSGCPQLSLQRHFSASTKFAHVKSWLCGRKQRGKVAFCTPRNPCARRACSRSIVVGLYLIDCRQEILGKAQISVLVRAGSTHKWHVSIVLFVSKNGRFLYALPKLMHQAARRLTGSTHPPETRASGGG